MKTTARPRIDFARISREALAHIDEIIPRWVPGVKRDGHEFVGLNPRRADHRLGNFKINRITGKWADFADSARGGDLVSLAAYLFDLDQGEAAKRVAEMLRIDWRV